MGNGGKPQAVRVVRQAVGIQKGLPKRPTRPGAGGGQGLAGKAIAMVLFMALGAYGIKQYKGYSHRAELERMPAVAAPAPDQPMPLGDKEAAASEFRCDGRTHCSQMTSCKEATWFINHCQALKWMATTMVCHANSSGALAHSPSSLITIRCLPPLFGAAAQRALCRLAHRRNKTTPPHQTPAR
ncbi:hypothetical protein AQB9606_02335 [Aquabacterium sp. CECT 9606]|nr:hypothetical protein AQB9606_02335 [Aquabacterium sp. CECT 9606]